MVVLEKIASVVFNTFEKVWGVTAIERSVKTVAGSVVTFAEKRLAVV